MILVIDNGSGNFTINHYPERLNKTEEELLEMGVLFESIPEPEVIEGKDAVLKFDGVNLYYEYVDRRLTLEEQLVKKDEQILQLKETQIATNRIVEGQGTSQQDLLELLIDMGVI